jgi:ABC-2 type transport system permease protein
MQRSQRFGKESGGALASPFRFMQLAAMEPSGTKHISTPKLFRLFLWMHWRAFRARMTKSQKESPLLGWILATFVFGYLLFGFWLFKGGLDYLYKFPLVGSLLAERILFLIFGFFFVMLTVSNLIIGYSTLFKNREAQWFLSLPVRHRDVYRWKFIEALAVSSWALAFLSAPMLAAFGVVHDVPWNFYFQVALGYIPFVIIPAVAGSWIILLLVRVLSRPWVKKAIIALAVIAMAAIIMGIKPVTEDEAAAVQEALLFPKLMQGTRLATNTFLPSSWLAEAVRAWSVEGLWKQGAFYFLLLTSWALMGLFLAFDGAGRLYYGSWSAALSSRAERSQREAVAKRQRTRKRTIIGWTQEKLRPISPSMVALIFKDIRIFWRDPAQWTQFMIFFGLLCIYVANLRNVAVEFKQAYWEIIISYLNLAASALTLSTLTTRFVYPMFSLEGRRIWILGLSPVGLRRVILQKFWLSFIVSSSITVALMVVSSLMLKFPWWRVAFFAGSIGLMSAALSGLSVGLGALFPDFKEDNPSKIVSSFGGTLCLVVSFVYNTVFVSLLALPEFLKVTNRPFFLPDWFTPVVAVIISLCMVFIPMVLATRKVKTLEL